MNDNFQQSCLLINKPPGISSNKVLTELKKKLNQKKAGFSGTLDPLASGLLIIFFNKATKLCSYFLDSDKKYEAIATLGKTSSTGDADGIIKDGSFIPNISINDDFITENDLSVKCLEEIDYTQGTIVIAVKPQVVENILITLREKLTSETTIISIVAGYSTKDIRNYIGKAPKLIRTMPNTPAAIGKGMTAIFSDSALSQNIRSEAEALFSAIGKYCWIED